VNNFEVRKKAEALLRVTVGTARQQHELQAYTAYGEFVKILKNDKALSKKLCTISSNEILRL
jgi:hypothetical protein